MGIWGAGRSKLGARAAPAGQGASNATGPRTRSIIHCSRALYPGNSSSVSGLLRGGSPGGRNHVTKDVIIKSTHRGLRYEDGRLTVVLEAGRYDVPERRPGRLGGRRPAVEIVVIDVRERELTIKGQEILTADKVAIRVSILTQFQVVDPVAAVEKVVSYEDRLYSDVQLAARRALASMTLEQILTSRHQLSANAAARIYSGVDKPRDQSQPAGD